MTGSLGRLVIATHNAGKLREFRELLCPYFDEIVSAGELGLPSPEETGNSFEENAILKAKAVAVATGSLALSDDSGLCVSALDGEPGIHSARWVDANGGLAGAINRIQERIGDSCDRAACFICVLALYWPEGPCETIEGRVDGAIADEPRGANGHGYDPIFVPDGFSQTFAEMSDGAKNAISHRGRAVRSLVGMLNAKYM